MNEKKIAVLFPGIGYHNEKPLLYYSGKLLKEIGYEVLKITYDFPFQANSIKGDAVQMKNAFDLAVRQTEKQLLAIDFSAYEKILFVGKSIGTTVAAAFDQTHGIGGKHIILTPVPQTFSRLNPECGIVFHGNADPWCETSLAIERCKDLGLLLHIIHDANHSLETTSVLDDIRNMAEVLRLIREYAEQL